MSLCLRELFIFPVIHTAQDMGSMNGLIQSKREKNEQIDDSYTDKLRRLWADIERSAVMVCRSRREVRLYQDGLPVCVHEQKIVDDMAASGSINHQLLQQLIGLGAYLMGTESADLLIDEYRLQKAILQSKPAASDGAKLAREAELLLDRRDRYIAQRINQTLKAQEVGMLFLGAMHHIERWLDKDIRVQYPIGRLQVSYGEAAK